MVWEPFFWLSMFAMNMVLIAFSVYQVICLTDLEADYMNPYETSSRINSLVIPEYLCHAAFCAMFLLTGHWVFFLVTLFPAYYNARRFMMRQHLIDVTEVFRFVGSEKSIRIKKLVFYFVLFVFVLTRLVFSAINAVADEGERLHFYPLF